MKAFLWLLLFGLMLGLAWCSVAKAQGPVITGASTGGGHWHVSFAWNAVPGATDYIPEPFLRYPVDSSLGRVRQPDTTVTVSVPFTVTTDSIVLQLWAEAPGVADIGLSAAQTFHVPPPTPPPPVTPQRMSYDEAIGRSVRAIRTWLGWSRAELADSAAMYAFRHLHDPVSESRVGAIETATGGSPRAVELTVLLNSMIEAIERQAPLHWLDALPLYTQAFLRGKGY